MKSRSPEKIIVAIICLCIAAISLVNSIANSTEGSFAVFFVFVIVAVILFLSSNEIAVFHHVSGLPIAENMPCTIAKYPDRLEFQSGTTQINLLKEKITDMRIISNTEVQKQYVSSVGGAIGGAVLLGPIGAVIGGRAKVKSIEQDTNYLVITYLKDEELKYIVLDIGNNERQAEVYVTDFNETKTNSGATIDL